MTRTDRLLLAVKPQFLARRCVCCSAVHVLLLLREICEQR